MKIAWVGSWLVIVSGTLPVLRLHWTLPFGAALFGMLTLGGAIGFVLLVLVHELGHAGIVKRQGLRTISIDLHGIGGECRYEPGWSTEIDRSLIAWGGVLAQGTLLVATVLLGRAFSPQGFLAQVMFAFVLPNAFMIVMNLAPVGQLDGALAWKLPGLLWKRSRKRAKADKKRRDAEDRVMREIESVLRSKKQREREDGDDDAS